MSRVLLVLAAACAAGGAVWVHGWRAGIGGRWARPRAGSIPRPAWWPLRHRGEVPVAELLDALAAELAVGQPTAIALESAAAGLAPDPCPRARRAARLGAPVPEALRIDAQAPGASALRGLAACWDVAEQSGAGLGSAVARLAETQRSTQRARELLTAELAAVRTSARLLGVLPLLGLALGHWLGTDPWGWLTGSAPGLVVLLAGGSLQLAGLFWLRRIVASVEGSL